MTPNEYQRLALRTEFTPTFIDPAYNPADNKHRLMHAAMGLCTEAAELLEAVTLDLEDKIVITRVKEECGDVLWYVALAANALGKPLDKICMRPKVRRNALEDTHQVVVKASLFVNELKRDLIYSKPAAERTLCDQLTAICQLVHSILFDHGISFDECTQANINKLLARYPNKFTSVQAIDRDLDAEAKALE